MIEIKAIDDHHGYIWYRVESDQGEVSGRLDYFKTEKVITFNLRAKTVPHTTTLKDIGMFLAALGGDIQSEAEYPVDDDACQDGG